MWGRRDRPKFNAEIGGVAWLIPGGNHSRHRGTGLTRQTARTDSTEPRYWVGRLARSHHAGLQLHAGIFPRLHRRTCPRGGAVVGIGAILLWERRESVFAGTVMAATVPVTAGWAFVLLSEPEQRVPAMAERPLCSPPGSSLPLRSPPSVPSVTGRRCHCDRGSGRRTGRAYGIRSPDLGQLT